MLNKPARRFTLVDLAVVLAVAAAVVFFFVRMVRVLDYQWEWDIIPGYFLFRDPATGRLQPNMLLLGFLTTIKLSAWSMVLAFFLGTVSGVMGAKGGFPSRLISRFYVETARNIPSLVLVILFYYFVSSQFLDALGLDIWLRSQSDTMQRMVSFFLADTGQINAFVSAAVALGIYEGAYISEIVRGGINSISAGQWEAAWSIGLSPFNTFRLVVLPQAFRKVAFPMAGQFISTIKDSAIVSVISVQELTFQGMELMAATFLTFEIWITITVLYFVLTFSLSRSISFVEKRMAIRQ
ncbi:MAG TPA: amino acid ABC transporter permease [Desulfotignum sp.]|nr:amino acid ABC transporter permease [Desulfotignum sp.]